MNPSTSSGDCGRCHSCGDHNAPPPGGGTTSSAARQGSGDDQMTSSTSDAHEEPVVHGLPVPTLVADSTEPPCLFWVARIDSCGVLSIKPALVALGWSTGTPLSYTSDPDVIRVESNRSGGHAVLHRGRIGIPSAMRRWFPIHAGDSLLTTVNEEQRRLLIYHSDSVRKALERYHLALRRAC